MQFMNRNFVIIEKIIATILVLYGSMFLYSTLFMVSTLTRIAQEQNIEKVDFLFLRISRGYSLSILGSSLTILGGVLLFFNKRLGWILSLLASLLLGVQLLIAIVEAYSLNNENAILISARIFMTTLFLSFTFCLLLRPYRIKYKILKN